MSCRKQNSKAIKQTNNNQLKRSYHLKLLADWSAKLVMAGFFLLLAPTLLAAPATPGGVRVEVYSDTALELFWDRAPVDAGISGYELSKNGHRLWLGDVTSYFDSGLQAGSSNSYSVIAMDRNGERSPSSRALTISLSGAQSGSCSGSMSCTSVSFSESTDDGNGLTGASLSVYSSTAAELFWKKTDAGSTFDIYRDGVYLQRTDGSSFFDPNRATNKDHHYEIIAIDANGSQIGSIAMANSGVINSSSSSNSANSSSSSSSSSSGSGSSSSSSSQISDSDRATNLRAAIYSSSAVELFWNGNSSGSAKYDVYRDNSWIGSTSGNSFYDNHLNAGSGYRYKLYESLNGESRLVGSVSVATDS